MKFVHLSDLHIGKTVNEISLLKDQEELLDKIFIEVKKIKPQAVLIAGDVYDKSVPSAQAVELFDGFLTKIAQLNLSIFIISGNHDSPERLGFGSALMESRKVYIYGAFSGRLQKITLKDENGNVNVYMLPFVKPAMVRPFFENEEINSYTDAVKCIIEQEDINTAQRNILIAHQFVTGAGEEAQRAESETISVGGVDNVDVSVFDKFDYVALGHLHTPQKVIRQEVRYSGSPFKYSFSECRADKSITIIDLYEKGAVKIKTVPLKISKDLRKIKGNIEDLTSLDVVLAGNAEDYLHVTLTNEEELIDPLNRLRNFYPNVMRLEFDNERTRKSKELIFEKEIENKSSQELFSDFYKQRTGVYIDNESLEIVKEIFERLEEV